MYKTFVIGYNPIAQNMAEEIEKKSNDLARDGYSVLSFSITNSGKAIILAVPEDRSVKNRKPYDDSCQI